MATPKIEPLSGLRMIHSSQKNRPLNKLLNINGNKVQNAKKFNNNVWFNNICKLLLKIIKIQALVHEIKYL